MPFSSTRPNLPTICLMGASSLALSAAALGADTEIDNDRTSPVDTTSLMGDSGTLTITENGSITVTSGTALTLSGNHNLLMQGTLQSDDATGGIGLAVNTDDLRLTSDIDIEGAFVISGPDDEDTATSNVGLGIFGTGIFDGDLNLQEGSTFSVTGADSRGLFLESSLIGDIFSDASIVVSGDRAIAMDLDGFVTGDVTIDGALTSRNADGVGLRIAGGIDGALIHQGSISVGESISTDDDGNTVDAVPAEAALLITSDISGGVKLAGEGADYVADDDEDEVIPTSSISAVGGGPGVLVENTKTDGSDLIIGKVSGTDFGFVHQGFVTVTGNSSGLDASGIVLKGGAGEARTILEGGIHLDDGRVDVNALDAQAVGIDIGEKVTSEFLWNRGIIETTTSVTYDEDEEVYSAGGDAVGISVAETGVLERFDNEGSLLVSASGEAANSYGLVDKSGTLSSITNSGVWYVVRGTNSFGDAVALDARANTSGISFTNEGTFTGDMWLGSGDDNVDLTDGDFDGDIDFGAGANRFAMSGEATYSGSMSHSGTLDVYLEGADLTLGAGDTLSITNATLSDDATLFVTIDPVGQTAGLLSATGTIQMDESVVVSPLFETFVTSEQSYEILEAGTLQFDGTLTSESGAFLMNSTVDYGTDGNSLVLTVRPKTVEELDFEGNRATLYENLFTSLDPEDDLGSALAKLDNAEEVEDAMQALMPDTTAAAVQLAYTGVQQLEAGINDRLLEVSAGRRLEGGFWARELVGYGNMTGATSGQAIDYLGAGILTGFDTKLSESVLWGFGGGFMLQGASRESKIGDDVSVFSPFLHSYLIATNGSAFASASASIWYNSVDRSREIEVETVDKLVESNSGGYTATADAHIGYDLKLGGFHLRPKVGVSYMKMHEGGYTEDGGDGANMVVEKRGYSRFDGIGRVALGHDFRWSKHTMIRPEIFAAYRKNLSGNEAIVTTARFASGEDWFTLDNDAVADDSYEMGAALNIFSGFGTASLRYTYENRDEWKAHYGGFNFQMRF